MERPGARRKHRRLRQQPDPRLDRRQALCAETYFYDFERTGQGHAIWDVADKTRHVFFPDIHERCLAFLRDVRGLPQPLPLCDSPLLVCDRSALKFA